MLTLIGTACTICQSLIVSHVTVHAQTGILSPICLFFWCCRTGACILTPGDACLFSGNISLSLEAGGDATHIQPPLTCSTISFCGQQGRVLMRLETLMVSFERVWRCIRDCSWSWPTPEKSPRSPMVAPPVPRHLHSFPTGFAVKQQMGSRARDSSS